MSRLPAPDRYLPAWARRSNPLVRRHLGGASPQPFFLRRELLKRILLPQFALVLLSFSLPELLNVLAALWVISFFALPVALVVYGRALLGVGRFAAEAVIDEQGQHALDILRMAPFSLRLILLSKIAAAVWRELDRLDVVVMLAALFSLPPVVLVQVNLWPPEQHFVVSRLLIAAELAASVVRLLAEPLWIGALGLLGGVLWRSRPAAVTWMASLGLAYFGLINLARLLALSWPLRLLVDAVLPVLLPLLLAAAVIWLAELWLRQD